MKETQRYEVNIGTRDIDRQPADREQYENMLILALARFGYGPYLSDKGVAFSIEACDLTPIHGED